MKKRDLQVLPVTLLSLFLQPETDTGLSLGFDASIAKALAPPASRQLPRGSHRPWAACRQRPVELGGGKRLISLGRLLRRRLPHIWPGAAHDLAELKPLLLRQAVLSRDLGGVLGLERLRQRPQRARLLFSSARGPASGGPPQKRQPCPIYLTYINRSIRLAHALESTFQKARSHL